MKFTIHEPGDVPAFVGGAPRSLLTKREVHALMYEGVWGNAGDNWLKVTADGSVWAGGASGKAAKMRGKDGRRLGGRSAMPEDEKRKTTSIQLAQKDREKLERMAEEATVAEGARVTISRVVERLVRHA